MCTQASRRTDARRAGDRVGGVHHEVYFRAVPCIGCVVCDLFQESANTDRWQARRPTHAAQQFPMRKFLVVAFVVGLSLGLLVAARAGVSVWLDWVTSPLVSPRI